MARRGPSISIDNIRRFEQEIGSELPNDYRAFLPQTIQIANGLLGGGNNLELPFTFSLTGRLFALGDQPVRFARRITIGRQDSFELEVP